MMRLLRAAKRARRMGKAQQTVPQKMAARLLRQDMAQEQKHRRHPQKRRVRRQPLRQTRPETMTWLTAQIQKTKTQNSQIEKKEDNTMETMNVKDFYFDLPQELIAQDPLEDRSSSRLLVLDKNTGETEHRHFRVSETGRLPGHQQYQGHSGPAVWCKRRYSGQDRGAFIKAPGE